MQPSLEDPQDKTIAVIITGLSLGLITANTIIIVGICFCFKTGRYALITKNSQNQGKIYNVIAL